MPTLTDEQITDLAEALDSDAAEVRVLRQVLDEIRDELSWSNRNAHAPPPIRITSMPIDPTADDWHINRFAPVDLLDRRSQVASGESSAIQQQLWS